MKGYGRRDQVGCWRSLQEVQIQGTKIKGSAPAGRQSACRAASRAASLDLGPLDLVSLDAALAADLIMASKSLHAPTTANPFLEAQPPGKPNPGD